LRECRRKSRPRILGSTDQDLKGERTGLRRGGARTTSLHIRKIWGRAFGPRRQNWRGENWRKTYVIYKRGGEKKFNETRKRNGFSV